MSPEYMALIRDLGSTLLEGIPVAAILLLAWQIWDTRRWNKMSCIFGLFSQWHELNDVECRLERAIRFITRSDPLSVEEVDQLFGEESIQILVTLKNYLGRIEQIALAANTGVIDDSLAFRLFGFKFVRHYDEMLPFINRLRRSLGDETIFAEIQRLSQRWRSTREQGCKY